MKRKRKYILVVVCGAAAALLDCIRFGGWVSPAAHIDFALAFAAFSVIMFDTDLALAACIAAGICLDMVSAVHFHTAVFIAYLAVANPASRTLFYSPKSPAGILFHLAMLVPAEAALYIAAAAPFHRFSPQYGIFLATCGATAAAALAFSAASSLLSNRFQAYRL